MNVTIPCFKVFVLLFLLSGSCSAQKILVFDRDAHAKRIHFKIQDVITVRTTGSEQWIKGAITDIGDSTITIEDVVIKVSRIDAIRYDNRSGGSALLRVIAVTFPVAGVGLLGINAINSVINNDYPVISKNALITAGALIVAGPVAYLFTYHKYKINKHHRLKVIDVSIR